MLSSGWWNNVSFDVRQNHNWKDELQIWLFKGFDLWGPSWSFTWQALDNKKKCVIGQLGEGDEANTIPVIIPLRIAIKLLPHFSRSWGGVEVEVSGVIGHRQHFDDHESDMEMTRGLLDYCIFIDECNKNHKIDILSDKTDMYSGYLWKCLVPKAWITDENNINLDNVYFVWEHTDFTKPDAVKYNLDSLENKERFIEKKYGDLVLLQKSSEHVPGTPLWEASKFCDLLQHKVAEVT